tara:strand:- start:705 stop:806 length:102 start_codon:yes stop_codon:yes gene_type:complete
MKELLQIFSEANVDPELLEYELAIDPRKLFLED